ncbi:MAG: SAM-dependent chlorinase/fluorinase [Flavobacteriaceae bacterium]|nr:SAM-dependent chlorinase/fluorinase [Flavobacteriaceae bacterium]MCY4215633.1 SAM-dependent chlorinase/fluorinase [Flavobacteriaceae bacterium]MCY4254445.1 SAM-dependent chlorinase/fluorinase [Flavobacteriaceae bacterium]
MNIITLTTDFGTKNYWLSAIKTKIIQAVPHVSIIDISHDISPYNYLECAYVLKSCIPLHKPNTVHIIGFEASPKPDIPILIVQLHKQFFVVADNGLMGLITQKKEIEQIISVSKQMINQTPFITLDTLTEIGIELVKGKSPTSLGTIVNQIDLLTPDQPIIDPLQSKIKGSIIYIDRYGNLVTNITQSIFRSVLNNQSFRIHARSFVIDKIFHSYSECATKYNSTRSPLGSKFAIFNSNKLLEIGVYKGDPNTVGSASSLYGLNYRDPITIEFFNSN